MELFRLVKREPESPVRSTLRTRSRGLVINERRASSPLSGHLCLVRPKEPAEWASPEAEMAMEASLNDVPPMTDPAVCAWYKMDREREEAERVRRLQQ